MPDVKPIRIRRASPAFLAVVLSLTFLMCALFCARATGLSNWAEGRLQLHVGIQKLYILAWVPALAVLAYFVLAAAAELYLRSYYRFLTFLVAILVSISLPSCIPGPKDRTAVMLSGLSTWAKSNVDANTICQWGQSSNAIEDESAPPYWMQYDTLRTIRGHITKIHWTQALLDISPDDVRRIDSSGVMLLLSWKPRALGQVHFILLTNNDADPPEVLRNMFTTWRKAERGMWVGRLWNDHW